MSNSFVGRKLHSDCLLNGVPASHISKLITSISNTLSMEHYSLGKSSTTIYRMIGELGFFSDVKTFLAVQSAENCTLVFDSTTQDGKHVNCVVLTTPSSSHLVSLERLPGGTAMDYKQHICDCINNLAKVCSTYF